jgi:hypothetical protein
VGRRAVKLKKDAAQTEQETLLSCNSSITSDKLLPVNLVTLFDLVRSLVASALLKYRIF